MRFDGRIAHDAQHVVQRQFASSRHFSAHFGGNLGLFQQHRPISDIDGATVLQCTLSDDTSQSDSAQLARGDS
jgi:hypothetical protein